MVAFGRTREASHHLLSPSETTPQKQERAYRPFLISGGERGIRTLDTLLTYTHFPGVRFQPLSHLSAARQRVSELTAQRKLNKLGELTEA